MKKVLSFVLVLAMILGCTSMAFAAYKDQADVTNTEAVAVLSAVGVFAGDNNGNMNPKQILTRAEACTIVARLMLGTAKADKQTATVAPFKDVPADNWAAGYISYCASKGIVGGIGNGEFNPTGTLKVGEFGKMLLCALGYDATVEGLVGEDWANNTSTLMNTAGIEVDEANNEDCAREVAAQLALSALEADCVQYESAGASISVGGTVIEFGKGSAQKVSALRKSGIEVTYKTTSDGALQLIEKLYGDDLTVVANDVDSFGRPGTTWKYKGDEVGTFGDAAKFTYTAEVTKTTMEKNLKGYTFASLVAITTSSAVTQTTGEAVGFTAASLAAFTGNGRVVEVFTDAKEITNIVVIVPKFAEITAVSTVKATSKHGEYTKYTIDSVTRNVYATVVDEDTDTDEAVLYGDFAKGDKVTYFKDKDNIFYVYPVSTLTGAVESYASNKTYTIDGTGYKLSTVSGAAASLTVDSKKSQDFYVDSYGYIIKSFTEEETKYAYVQNVESLLKVDADGIGKQTTYATLVFTDGTVEKVQANDNGLAKGSIVGYTVNSKDVYTLTNAAADLVDYANALPDDATSVGALLANTKTVYYVLGYDYADSKYTFNKTVKTYTGYKNAPVYSTASVAAVETKTTTKGTIDVVFIDTHTDAVETGKYVYVKGTHTYDGKNYEYDVIVAGEDTTIKAATAVTTVDALYSSFGDTFVQASVSGQTIESVGNLVYIDGTAANKTIEDDAPVYLIDINDDTVETLEGSDLDNNKINANPSGLTTTLGARGVYLELSGTKVVAVYVLFNSED